MLISRALLRYSIRHGGWGTKFEGEDPDSSLIGRAEFAGDPSGRGYFSVLPDLTHLVGDEAMSSPADPRGGVGPRLSLALPGSHVLPEPG